MRPTVILAALLCALTIHAADARPRDHRHHIVGVNKLVGCSDPVMRPCVGGARKDRQIPAPGMVAARRGHVFVLKRHLHGKVWLVWDANSGRGKTRIHPRSIAGFTIVDPRAGA